MSFDDIMVEIGEFGRYQRTKYLLCCLFTFPMAFQLLASVFITESTDHWCRIPEWDDVDCAAWGFNTTVECEEAKRSVGIPISNDSESDGDVIYAQCKRYNLSAADYFRPNLDLGGSDVIPCDAGWVYDRSQFESTIVTDFDLVCGSSYLASVSQSLYFGGVLIGSILFGFISDIIGRQKCMFLCCGLLAISGTALSFSPNIWVFSFLDLVVGAVTYGVVLSSYVLGTEMVGPSWRYFAGVTSEIFFASGYLCLTLIAFFIRNWRRFQLSISVVPIAYFVLYPFLPESARWLMAKRKFKPAEKILRKAAEVNKAELSEPIFQEDHVIEEKYEEQQHGRQSTIIEEQQHGRQSTIIDLFRTPRLRRNTLNLMFNWIVNTLVYYGISLSTGTLGVNYYVAFFVSGAVEIPSYISVLFGINLIGRRPMLVTYMGTAGLASLATIFIPAGPGRVVAAMIGKFGIAGSFAIAYLYAAEIFPTPVRCAGLGLCSMAARVAGMIAPLILELSSYWTPFPLVIFSCASCLAAFFALFLPETRGMRVPETIEEAENFGRFPQSEKSTNGDVKLKDKFKYQKAPDSEKV